MVWKGSELLQKQYCIALPKHRAWRQMKDHVFPKNKLLCTSLIRFLKIITIIREHHLECTYDRSKPVPVGSWLVGDLQDIIDWAGRLFCYKESIRKEGEMTGSHYSENFLPALCLCWCEMGGVVRCHKSPCHTGWCCVLRKPVHGSPKQQEMYLLPDTLTAQ